MNAMDAQTVYKLIYLGGDVKAAIAASRAADKAYADLVKLACDLMHARATGIESFGLQRKVVDAARTYAYGAHVSDDACGWVKDQAAKIGNPTVDTAVASMTRTWIDGESARRTYHALVWLDPERVTDEWSDLFDEPEWVMQGFDANADAASAKAHALDCLKKIAEDAEGDVYP